MIKTFCMNKLLSTLRVVIAYISPAATPHKYAVPAKRRQAL
jgi:hypothetical protein